MDVESVDNVEPVPAVAAAAAAAADKDMTAVKRRRTDAAQQREVNSAEQCANGAAMKCTCTDFANVLMADLIALPQWTVPEHAKTQRTYRQALKEAHNDHRRMFEIGIDRCKLLAMELERCGADHFEDMYDKEFFRTNRMDEPMQLIETAFMDARNVVRTLYEKLYRKVYFPIKEMRHASSMYDHMTNCLCFWYAVCAHHALMLFDHTVGRRMLIMPMCLVEFLHMWNMKAWSRAEGYERLDFFRRTGAGWAVRNVLPCNKATRENELALSYENDSPLYHVTRKIMDKAILVILYRQCSAYASPLGWHKQHCVGYTHMTQIHNAIEPICSMSVLRKQSSGCAAHDDSIPMGCPCWLLGLVFGGGDSVVCTQEWMITLDHVVEFVATNLHDLIIFHLGTAEKHIAALLCLLALHLREGLPVLAGYPKLVRELTTTRTLYLKSTKKKAVEKLIKYAQRIVRQFNVDLATWYSACAARDFDAATLERIKAVYRPPPSPSPTITVTHVRVGPHLLTLVSDVRAMGSQAQVSPEAMKTAMNKQLTHAIEPPRRNYVRDPNGSKHKTNGGDDDDDVRLEVTEGVRQVSLRCPLSMRWIRVPGRFAPCIHPQTFDFETFVQMQLQVKRALPTPMMPWKCPLCKTRITSIGQLGVDAKVKRIVNEVRRRYNMDEDDGKKAAEDTMVDRLLGTVGDGQSNMYEDEEWSNGERAAQTEAPASACPLPSWTDQHMVLLDEHCEDNWAVVHRATTTAAATAAAAAGTLTVASDESVVTVSDVESSTSTSTTTLSLRSVKMEPIELD